jgi:hypothetical protein
VAPFEISGNFLAGEHGAADVVEHQGDTTTVSCRSRR